MSTVSDEKRRRKGEQMQENLDAAYAGLRYLARNAEADKLRFRACEYLLPVPMLVYSEGCVRPEDLEGTKPVGVLSDTPAACVTRLPGADVD